MIHWTLLEGFVLGFGITMGGIAAVALVWGLIILYKYFTGQKEG